MKLIQRLVKQFTSIDEAKKVKAGKGNMHIDVDPDAIPDKFVGPKWMGQMEKKHGMMIRFRKNSYVISGQKKGIVSFVTTELGWDEKDIKNMWPELLESAMKARVAGSKRVHHSELVKDMDRDAMIDYMMKDRNFAKAVAKAKVSRKDIYFDDNELVFGDKTVASFKKNDKVSDMMSKVK